MPERKETPMKFPSLKTIEAELAKAKKTVVAAVGVVALLATSPLVSGTVHTVLESILAAATALGVYVVKNAAP
jgi:hypothetical protein